MLSRLLAIAAVLLLCGAFQVHAADVIYDINFTVSPGYSNELPWGYFVFDTASNTFTDFKVLWMGELADLTAGANNLANIHFDNADLTCAPSAASALITFEALVTPSNCPGNAGSGLSRWSGKDDHGQGGFGFSMFGINFNTSTGGDMIAFGSDYLNAMNDGDDSQGSWTVMQVDGVPQIPGSTPEPFTAPVVALLLGALGLAIRGRRRLVR